MVQPEVIATAVGVVLILLGLVVAIRPDRRGSGQPGEPVPPGQTAKLGPLEVTGPGLPLVLLGIFALFAPGLLPSTSDDAEPDLGTPTQTSPGENGPETPRDGPGPDPTPEPAPEPEPSATEAPGTSHAVTVPGFGFVDLDRARVVDAPTSGGDVALVVPGSLVPLSVGQLAVTADVGSAAACDTALASYADAEVGYEDLQRGASFCTVTDEGRLAGVLAEPWEPNGPLDLSWQLWEQG